MNVFENLGKTVVLLAFLWTLAWSLIFKKNFRYENLFKWWTSLKAVVEFGQSMESSEMVPLTESCKPGLQNLEYMNFMWHELQNDNKEKRIPNFR